MQAQERVYEQLIKITCDKGRTTASELAEQLNLSRQVTSHYLNRLLEQQKAVKTDTRPVYWSAWKAAQGEEGAAWGQEGASQGQAGATPSQPGSLREPGDVFSVLIGAGGSQRNITMQCKAAVNYPPDGLPILIIGESGVGKSFMAGLVCSYARSQNAIPGNAPFVVLNCADYANNPELLSAALFGYKKGSFTGAVSDKTGLLKEADGGMLFLDEVHRLSYENQEKLFVFMDTGRYRPLGDSSWKEARVRFIFATTEKPEDVLLETFRRRITVQVNVPSMMERPLSERLELLHRFYEKEAGKVGRDMEIDKKVVSVLCFSKMKGNIGKLKNLVQLSCANAYFRHGGSGMLQVTMADLPQEAWTMPDGRAEGPKSMVVSAAGEGSPTPYREQADGGAGQLLQLFADIGQTDYKQFSELAPGFLLRFKRCAMDILRGEHRGEIQGGDVLRELYTHICTKVMARYGVRGQREMIGRMYALTEATVVRDLPELSDGRLADYFGAVMPRAFYVAGKLEEELDNCFFAAGSLGGGPLLRFICSFFLSECIAEHIEFRGLIAAHGDSTASSIQAVANQVCGTYVYEAIDMPMDASVEETIQKVKQYLEHENTGKGVILLVDMGSLSQMYSSIKASVSGDLLIVNNLTTCIALDIGFKMVRKMAFKEIAEAAGNGYPVSVQYFEGVAKGNNIIVSCMSGVGIADKIKDMLVRVLGEDGLDIISMEYRELRRLLAENQEDYFSKTKLILTTSNLSGDISVPWINIYDLIGGAGERKIWAYLRSFLGPEKLELLNREFVKFFSLEGIVSRLQFLNPTVVINEVENVIMRYEQHYHLELPGRTKLNLYMHIAFMIERLMTGEQDQEESVTLSPQESAFCQVSEHIFKDIENRYHISLNQYELSLLYELFRRVIE